MLAELILSAEAGQLGFLESMAQKYLFMILLLEQYQVAETASLSMQAFYQAVQYTIHPVNKPGHMHMGESVHISFDTAMFHCHVIRWVKQTAASDANSALQQQMSKLFLAVEAQSKTIQQLSAELAGRQEEAERKRTQISW